MMNSKLQEERFKAKQLLEYANQLQMESLSVPRATFNLSDLKSDKTQYIESPYHRKRSPFKSSEISARSTLSRQHVEKNTNNDMDFDEIMRTSSSQAVRNKYRESIGMGRLSSLPRTEDMSFRSTMSTSSFPRNADRNDFWDDAKIAVNSFDNQQVSMDSDEFQPAEKMMEQIADDEMEQQKEFATIPRVKKTNSNESNWQERSSRQPEMSFGQYCQDYVEDIRDIYSSNSPTKKNRVALVDVSNVDVSLEPPNRIGRSHLQKLIQNYDTPKAEELILNVGRNINRLHDNIATKARTERDPVISGIDSMLNSMNFDEIIEKAKRNAERARIEKENSQAKLDSIPVQDEKKEFLYPDDSLNREINAIPGRGQKRRSVNLETPRSALDKCMRSKSPDEQRVQKQLAASMLKPKFYDNEFKVPHSSTSIKPNFSSTIFSPMRSSRAESRTDGSHNHSPTSREYVTANSMNSPAEKLSLPNYGLVRPENPFTSPTSSLRSDDLSPIAPEEGKLKRTVSQLSNGSEFYDDVLPIKIKKAHMKVSWESVKLYKTVSKTVSIQNGSHKKLPLKVRVIGAGFSVAPREDFRMIPQEARSFEVRFTPTVIGPVRGQLVFELATNNKVSKTIPLFAYGGHAAIRIEGVQKGPLGPAFVTMGHVNGLNRKMEQQLRLVNHGTLPGFASLLFEKTKWSDFSLSSSLNLSPSQVRLGPGESVEINVAFRATKDEIFKIIKLNKEVTIVGEICIIAGDEPTRLRLINNKEHVPTQFLKFLPKGLPNEVEFKRELVLFNENLDRTKLSSIMEQIKTHEVALTVSRNLDETQIFAADLSMADETTLTFETFCDTNCNRTVFDPKSSNETLGNDPGFFDCRFFRLVPAQLIFSRSRDDLHEPKSIFIESTSDDELFVEAVSSNHELITAIKSCGVIKPHGTAQFKVTLKTRAQDPRIKESMYVTVLIGNAKVDVPVKFVN